MALSTDIADVGRPQQEVAGERVADRGKALRRARIYSRIVRLLRMALPALAAGSLVSYGIALRLAMPPTVKGFNPGKISISTEDLVMENPKYDGFNKDGGSYWVTSKTAKQDIRQKGPVHLETVTGKLTQPDRSVTDLFATRGTYDTKKSELELFDGIDVVSQNGMRAKLSRATILTKESTIVSREPVKVEMPTGEVTSNQLEVYQKTKQVAFIDNVVTTLRPEQKQGAAASKAQASPAQPRMVGASGQPVVVNSSRLDVDDLKKLAMFRGGVRAVQGQATMQSEELEAYYEGQTGAAGAQKGEAGRQDASSKLSRLISRVPVVLTNAADRATSDAADFNVKDDTAVLLGNVVITSGTDRRATSDRADVNQKDDTVLLTGQLVHVVQGKNELKGRRLWVDRKAGRSLLTTPAENGRPAGRITAKFYQTEQKPGAAARKSAPATQDQEGSGAFGFTTFKTDPNAPIDIESDSLDVNDNSKQAVFRGRVQAVQGEFHMQTVEMTALYTGQAGLAAGADAAKSAPGADAKAGAQLNKIEARKGVIITSKDQKVTGQWADFDVKSNTAVVGGDEVILTQGKNIVRGTRLLIDMNTGEARVVTPDQQPAVAGVGGPAQQKPDVTAGQGPYTPLSTGRARMVLFPNEAKKAHEKAKQEGKSPAEAAAAAAAAATGGAWQPSEKQPLPKKADPTASSNWDARSAFPDAGRN